MPGVITIPIQSDFNEKEYYGLKGLSELMERLSELKLKKDNCSYDHELKVLKRQLQDVIKSNLNISFEGLFDNKESILFDFAKILKSELCDIDISNKDEMREIYNLIICYQLYDHDGVTFLFFPENKDSKCCLALLVPCPNFGKVALKKDELIVLVDTLSPLPMLEKKIYDIVQHNIVKKDIWKSHYLSRRELYDSLCLHMKILLQYICRKNNIKTVDVSFRVKEFDSFFNRVIDRFNEPDRFKIDGADIEAYRDSFLSGDEESADMVFSKFWDIAGIRILCVFNEDLSVVFDELCLGVDCSGAEIFNNTYLINVFYIDKKIEYDYRADHYILSLGCEREKHPELTALGNLKCEVQVKTTLSQGWSEADHDLIYKSELSQHQIDEILKKCDVDQIGENREHCSMMLYRIDKEFDVMRGKIKQRIDES